MKPAAALSLLLTLVNQLSAAEPTPLQAAVDRGVARALADFAGRGLKPDELAVTAVDLADPAVPVQAAHRGDAVIYPASVIKLFYLAAAHRWLEDGRLEDTPELRRALSDMIVHSYNEATHYVIDLLTGTTSGPELMPDSLRAWFEQREAVNRHFHSLGYDPRLSANKKPWCEGPYGREVQAIRAFTPSRNWLTTDATARLMVEIFTGRCVTPARSAQMRELMVRDVFAPVKDAEDQTHGFTGLALLEPARQEGAKLWSKAGWTSQTRHDAAYVEFPDGRRGIVVIFTEQHANERNILPTVAREIFPAWRRP